MLSPVHPCLKHIREFIFKTKKVCYNEKMKFRVTCV